MRAVLLKKINCDLEIENIELTDLQFGQVLVKNLVSGICGAQLHEINGHKNNEKFLPHLMGHEGCGIVQAIGEGVTNVNIGDKVIMHWRKSVGIESDFPKYLFNNKIINGGKITTLSEYSIVSENRLTSVPMETPNYLAAMLGCSLSTAFGIIDNECENVSNKTITIIGCGGVGLNLIQAAKQKGAFVIAVDKNKNKKKLIMEIGADLFTDKKISSDYIIDTTGITSIINDYFNELKGGGKFILVGQPKPKENLLIKNALSFFDGEGKTIKATQGGQIKPQTDMIKYINLFKNNKIDYKKIITHEFELDKINEAFDLLKSGEAGRIMIKIS